MPIVPSMRQWSNSLGCPTIGAGYVRELVDFDQVSMSAGQVVGFVLTASGKAARAYVSVALEPLGLDSATGWWNFEVVGYRSEAPLKDLSGFTVEFVFDEFSVGAGGIKVVGKTTSEKVSIDEWLR